MKPCTCLVLMFTVPLMAADHAAWTHRQTLEITQPGLHRLDLEPALLDASRGTSGTPFHDLRLVNQAGVEMPYAVLQPADSESGTRQAAMDFKQSLRDTTTEFEFRAPAGRGTVRGISLSTPAFDFIKAASLEASVDGSTWQTLIRDELLCRQPGIERLSLRFRPGAWSHFRVLLDDRRTSPVVFSGAFIHRDPFESVPVTVPHTVTIQSREERAGETHLMLNLGVTNLRLATLRLRTPEQVFQRRFTLAGRTQTLFRIQHDGHSAEALEVPLHQLVLAREIELVIHNESNPPLRIEGFDLTRHPTTILFQADAPGEWQLYVGNAQAEAPMYDIAALTSQLRQAAASTPKAGAVTANTAFRKEATAPAVGATGSKIDVSAWARRRSIEIPEVGVVEVELDPEVLAHSARDFADLRVIRDGQQLPYLLKHSSDTREVDASFELVSDAKRPTMSVWKVSLPFVGYPVHGVVLESDSPLFERLMLMREENSAALNSFRWTRQPNQQASPMNFSLDQKLAGDAFIIETDNGDNAPLHLTRVRLKHRVINVWFHTAAAGPAYLYYAQPQAAAPRYDLTLMRTEFERAAKIPGKLGAAETLHAIETANASSTSGGPMLWAALALVVGVLLWVIRRLLPKIEAPGSSP